MKKIIKYVFLSLAIVIVVASLSINGYNLYRGYVSTLQAEGYGQAMQLINMSLTQEGKVVLNKKLPDGTLDTVTLVPEAKPDAKKTAK